MMLADAIEHRLATRRNYIVDASAPRTSDFVRFNAGKVRQTGHVRRAR